jgi:hypothetical protein
MREVHHHINFKIIHPPFQYIKLGSSQQGLRLVISIILQKIFVETESKHKLLLNVIK